MTIIKNMLENRGKFLTSNEAAEYLGLKPSTLHVWRCTKRFNLPYIKVGRLVKYKISDLDDFISRRTITDKGGE
jgi:excisionase family DNA binding protein